MSRSARLVAFLEALETAEPNAFCSPPGLGGGWRVKHVRSGMARKVLVVHHSGEILAYQIPNTHGVCPECKARRTPCEHCNCAMCAFDREISEHGGKPVTKEQIAQLRAKIAAFQFGQPKPVVRLDGE